MKLSDLKTGEKGIIVKVLGHGGFRKRIIEMGFIKGKEVEVLLNAPLQDPVKYKLMGYEVSLRHHEAEMIEVVSSLEFRTESVEFLRPSGSKRAELERTTAPQDSSMIESAAVANSKLSTLNSTLPLTNTSSIIFLKAIPRKLSLG